MKKTLSPSDTFVHRHLGPDADEIQQMLSTLGYASLDELSKAAVPDDIQMSGPLQLPDGLGEHEALARLRSIASKNLVARSYIGMGYADCITPTVILRNILENPGWYTAYTPYQAEIAQGRLEALLNFQTMISDLTGLPLANASLLDEGTAAAEAMMMCVRISKNRDGAFLVAADCHPQTIALVQARAEALGINVLVSDPIAFDYDTTSIAGVLLQYPTTDGRICDYRETIEKAHAAGALVTMAADLLALTLITPPGELGADIAIGTSQRFGVPMGAGGPHAGYMSTRTEHARRMPGRLIGVSRDVHGSPAYRMAIQTREQHIRREKATSNICTAQVLLAVIAGMYAVYHGPEGLRRIAGRVHGLALALHGALSDHGHGCGDGPFFDTIRVRPSGMDATTVMARAQAAGMNLRQFEDGTVGISLDETTTRRDVLDLLSVFDVTGVSEDDLDATVDARGIEYGEPHARQSGYLTHEVFNAHHSEAELVRYMATLESRDLSLTHSMIPLGSCTMKLNGTTEMIPVTWPEFGRIHPFAPREQVEGYAELYGELESWLAEITGFASVSLQPNAGAQGEYAGLMVIRAYHRSRGDENRTVCIIPTSAHGTNPASAVAAGFEVVAVRCLDNGSIDLEHLQELAETHADRLGAVMITYPSTFGVFESKIRKICDTIHSHGGMVYLDGANMNAQVGLCRPGDYGADVCHLNLHKTFCIPHGGGGPGMGPIGVVDALVPFLPGHPVAAPGTAGEQAIGLISAAPYGSPSILPISWMYIALMGAEGLRRASQVAILSANYMAKRLEGEFDILFRGEVGLCAHEFIIDCRSFDKAAGIKIDDIAKRLMDFGFHAPTMSWPVPGTLMLEPTESEPKQELDRLCDALISIRREIRDIEEGVADRQDNPLKNAPHTIRAVTADEWAHPYTREQAAFPAPDLHRHKFWPAVGRVDNPFGDRNLVCNCPPVSAFVEAAPAETAD